MPYTLRAPLAALCLSLILPCIQPAMAADPAPAKEPAATEPVVERAPLLSRSKEDAQALERQLPLQEQQQLQAGDETFLALWKPANSSDPKGAVIIIPGADESADWPDAVGPLRRKFPDVGWASLSLTLPDMLGDTPQARVFLPGRGPAGYRRACPAGSGSGWPSQHRGICGAEGPRHLASRRTHRRRE